MLYVYLIFFLPCLAVLLILLWDMVSSHIGSKKEPLKVTTQKMLTNLVLLVFPVLALFSFCFFPFYEVGIQDITGMDLFTGDYFLLMPGQGPEYKEAFSYLLKGTFVLYCICCINPILAYNDTHKNHIFLGVMMFFAPLAAYLSFSIKGLFAHYGVGYKGYIICTILYILVAFAAMIFEKQGKKTEKVTNLNQDGYCSHCGMPLSKDQNFCPKCGTKRS